VIDAPSFPCRAYPEYRIGLPDERLVQAVRDFDPEVVHYLNPFAFGFACYDVLRRRCPPTPSVFSFHTLYGEFVKRYPLLRPLSRGLWSLAQSYHNCADVNLTVSAVMQQELSRRGFERVELWPPAVDSELFHPRNRCAAMRARLGGGDPREPLVLTVSRLAPEKNLPFLAAVMRRIPAARLAVVGDGPQRSQLERQFDRQRTRFVGYLHGRELAAAYASADAFAYASETETLGNVILEAMASGLPPVAPRAGGIPSLVEHNRTGRLYDPGRLESAAEYLRLLLDHPGERDRLGAAARAAVAAWTWPQAADVVRQHYRAALVLHEPARAFRRRLVAPVASRGLTAAFRAIATRSPTREDAAFLCPRSPR
jgi:glycosyltransferase involved in cell wall biosynthesis